MKNEEVFAMLAGSPTLRRNEAPEAGTIALQMAIKNMGIDPGPVDGIFGGRTENAVILFQSYRLDGESTPDGVVDPITGADLQRALREQWEAGRPWPHARFDVMVLGGLHPDLGYIPDREGRMSTFGGPDDPGDRGYGQACVPCEPSTVAKLYELYGNDLVQLGVFRSGLSDPLPMVTCCGRTMRAGISWCLNPESYYIAMRWHRGKYPSPQRPWQRRVLVIHGDKACVCAPTDYGPATWTGRDCDISPGCADALYLEPDDNHELKTDNTVITLWAADGAPLGPVSLR
jgi:hypothetical protein